MVCEKVGGVVLAFLHMMITELRVWIILAFGSYKQYQAIASYRATNIAMTDEHLINCLANQNVTYREIETCILDLYNVYLVSGPSMHSFCKDTCPGVKINYMDWHVFIMVWMCQALAITGYSIMLLSFFKYKPNYFKGDYLYFTQSMYTSTLYKCLLKPISLIIILLSVVWTVVLSVVWNIPGISVILPIILVLMIFYTKTFYPRFFEKPYQLKSVKNVIRGKNLLQKVGKFFQPNQEAVVHDILLQVSQVLFPQNITAKFNAPLDEEGLRCFLGDKAPELLKSLTRVYQDPIDSDEKESYEIL